MAFVHQSLNFLLVLLTYVVIFLTLLASFNRLMPDQRLDRPWIEVTQYGVGISTPDLVQQSLDVYENPLSKIDLPWEYFMIFKDQRIHNRAAKSPGKIAADKIKQKPRKLNPLRSAIRNGQILPNIYPQLYRDSDAWNECGDIKVPDPYRWLEQQNLVKTKDFVKVLNTISSEFFNSSPFRDKIREELNDLWNTEIVEEPMKWGDYYYYFSSRGLRNQKVLMQKKHLSDPGKVFLDPNEVSSNDQLDFHSDTFAFSPDGKILAYGLSLNGSDSVTIKFKTVDGKDFLGFIIKSIHIVKFIKIFDTIMEAKFGQIAWKHDEHGNYDGIFYSKYFQSRSAKGNDGSKFARQHSLFYHKLGTHGSDDIRIFAYPYNTDALVAGKLSENGHYLYAYVFWGSTENSPVFTYYGDLKALNYQIRGPIRMQQMREKSDEAEISESLRGITGERIHTDPEEKMALVRTNQLAKMYKIVKIPIGEHYNLRYNANTTNAEGLWGETVVPEDPRRLLLKAYAVAGDKLLLHYLEDAKSVVFVHDRHSGRQLYRLPFDFGSLRSVFAKPDESEIFLTFESYLNPTTIWYGDFRECTGINSEDPIKLSIFHQQKVPASFKRDNFLEKQIFAWNDDGTRIPVFVVHSKNIRMEYQNPTILYGYGAFNEVEYPIFSSTNLLLLQHFNIVLAYANIRGGGEYGMNWHNSGRHLYKQKSIDDFHAVSEQLIRMGYTSESRLVVEGDSAGGLLVAAAVGQRPELYQAMICNSGLLDMLRFDKYTVGGTWKHEFGDPKNPRDFRVLREYSPLHNIEALQWGQQWPATLLTAALDDDRVPPAHTLKYAAELYHTIGNEMRWQTQPLVVRMDDSGGHNQHRNSLKKYIEHLVDRYSFIQLALNISWIN